MKEGPKKQSLRELTAGLVGRELSEEERRSRGLLLPRLRLRADAPTVEIDETTRVNDALSHLTTEAGGILALQEAGGPPSAVVLSVERYLELASKEIRCAPRVGAAGYLVPQEEAFERALVEQSDPNARWPA